MHEERASLVKMHQINIDFANNSTLAAIIEEEKRKKRRRICIISAVTLAVVFIVLLIAIIIVVKLKQPHNDDPAGGWLCDIEPYKRWNIIDYIYGKENIQRMNATAIKVTYPQGSFQNTGGFKFYAQPQDFPRPSACLRYDITLANNFDFVKGGKLPGFWIGDRGANGGNHLEDSSSFRAMWRTDGMIEAYIYLPDETVQKTEFYEDPTINHIFNNEYGHSVWRDKLGRLDPHVPNHIELCLKVNTFDKNKRNFDGVIQMTVNNITRSFSKLVWTTDPNMKVSGLLMNTFFGGNDETWAATETTDITFSNFAVGPFTF